MTEDEIIRDQMWKREVGERLWNRIVKEKEIAEQQTAIEKARADAATQALLEKDEQIRALQEELASYKK